MAPAGHADRAHARLSASGSKRWMECPGSVRLSDGIPNKSSAFADEGTAAHELAEMSLRREGPQSFLGRKLGPSETVVDEEMLDNVQVYLDAVWGEWQDGDQLFIEQKFTRIAELHPDLGGTGDAVIYRPSTGELFVFDLKYGRGVAVEVEHNPQLLTYGLGAAYELMDRGISVVHLIVVQPRKPHPDGPVRRWSLDAMSLMDWTADLITAAKRTADPDAPLSAGEHCRFCPAAGFCPALRDRAMDLARVEFVAEAGAYSTPGRPAEMDSSELGDILRAADVIEIWLKAVQTYAHAEANAGRPPTGFKLVRGTSRRAWKDEAAARTFLDVYGMDEADMLTTPTLKSPAQIEGVIGKKNAKDIADLITKPPGKVILAGTDDPRDAVMVDPASEFTAA